LDTFLAFLAVLGVLKIETSQQHRFCEILVNRVCFCIFTFHGKSLMAYLEGGSVSVVKPYGTNGLILSLRFFYLPAQGVVIGYVRDHIVMFDDVGVVFLGVFVLS